MNLVFSLVVHTANVLGIFTDPFEFEGDYGAEINPIRQQVFDLIVSKEALAKHLPTYEIKANIGEEAATLEQIGEYRQQFIAAAIKEDQAHGPVLGELITPSLIQALITKQKSLPSLFSQAELEAMLCFLEEHQNQKVFYFFRHVPAELNIDKTLRDKASRAGKNFDLPILSSTQPLTGQTSDELKKDLLQALFTEEILQATKSSASMNAGLSALDQATLGDFFGPEASPANFQVFCSPAGQVFFYWLYQSLNLHLVSQEYALIEQINKVKTIFAQTLGNPIARAERFREKLIQANASVVFTQESDTYTPETLTHDGLFYAVNNQIQDDGCFVFLRSTDWEPDFQLIAIDDYAGYQNGHLSLVLATQKNTGKKFLLVAGHGHHTKAEDGRLQIALVMQKHQELVVQYPGLQLVMGTDANTKTEEDVRALRQLLETLGLTATSVGPTTIKKRMVSAQHSKVGRQAVDEEDYLLTLKPENGGDYLLSYPTLGFSEERADISIMLPNFNNLADHYSVGATLILQD